MSATATRPLGLDRAGAAAARGTATSPAPLVLLGQSALLSGPPERAAREPELRSPASATAAGEELVRSLAGQLETAPAGMSRWARLDRYGRALATAADRATERRRLTEGPPTGIFAASHLACLETNVAFHEGLLTKGPRLASPLLFPYTLPGSAAAEIAMLLQLTGPYLVFAGGPCAALAMLLTACDTLVDAPSQRLLLATADVLGPASLALLDARAGGPPGAIETAGEPGMPVRAEAAAAVWLGSAQTESAGRRLLIEGALGPAGAGAEILEELAREALTRAGLTGAAPRQVVIASRRYAPTGPEMSAAARVAPLAPVLGMSFRAGDCGASLGLLGFLAALEEDSPALVIARDEGGSVALVVGGEL